jgi:hypothetical protein
MMSRSSTSSSEPGTASTDEGRAAPPAGASGSDPQGASANAPLISVAGRRALLLCLALLLLVEVGAARRDWAWRIDPRRPVGIMLAVEDEIIAPADDARVILVGSSVMRDALLPRVFEQAAGLPRGSVLNTSLPNATPFDFVLLYERNREVFAHARLLVIGVEDWYFYEEPGVPERYQRWASLQDRLADYSGRARLPVLVSWLWQTYAARQALAFDGIAAALRGDRAEVIGDDGRTRWRAEEQALGSDAFDLRAYEARLRERRWSDQQVRYLRRLLQLAASDRVPVLVVRLPMRAAAFALRRRIDPEAEDRLQQALREAGVGDGAVRLLDVPVGDTAGLEERHFLDERHLGTRGADVFTRYLATYAATEYDLR